jgi:type I restriction enzyme M protein
MIDASKGFMKDGPKNRLREQDIHRIVDTFARQAEVPGYARMVPVTEIGDLKNDYNLNLPRYIDSAEAEDLHDIDGHLRGGIPERDLDTLGAYWKVLPSVREILFESAGRAGYAQLRLSLTEVNATVLGHAEFTAFQEQATQTFADWSSKAQSKLVAFDTGGHPKALIETIAGELLAAFRTVPLLDAYDVYQHLMNYWAEAMQDDAYLIAADGWVAVPARIVETDKKGKRKDKGWSCDLVPKSLIVARYFAKEQAALDAKQTDLEATAAVLAALEEEHGGDDGVFNGYDGVTSATVKDRIREIGDDRDGADELKVLQQWLDLGNQISSLKRQIKEADTALDALALGKYPKLTEADIKALVIDDKWMARLAAAVQGELDRVSQSLTTRIRELAERYAAPLPQLTDEVATLAARVEEHLAKMGASWK